MNLCFLFIKRVSKIEFRFMIYHKSKAKVSFEGVLTNGSKIQLFAYDELADFLYQREPDFLFLQGKLKEDMEVEITEIYKIEKVQKYLGGMKDERAKDKKNSGCI